MGFPRQEYWNGLSFPSPSDLSKPGIKLKSPALQADSHQGNLPIIFYLVWISLFSFANYVLCLKLLLFFFFWFWHFFVKLTLLFVLRSFKYQPEYNYAVNYSFNIVIYSASVVLNQKSPGDIWLCLKTFLFVTAGVEVGSYSIWWVEARDAA